MPRWTALLLFAAACAAHPSDDLPDAGAGDDAGFELSPDAGSELSPDAGSDAGFDTAPDAGLPEATPAQLSRAKADLANYAHALARARTDTGSLAAGCVGVLENLASANVPAGCGAVPACAVAPPGQACWGGPYVTSVRPDPWGHPYTVEIDADSGALTVRCAGADGAAKTADDLTQTM